MKGLFNSIRSLFGYTSFVEDEKTAIEQWQQVDAELLKANDELTKVQQEFDEINNELMLKIVACDKLIEKGVEEGQFNKTAIQQKLDRITNQFLIDTQLKTIEIDKLQSKKIELESNIITKSIEITSLLSEQEQDQIHTTISEWKQSGSINGEKIDSQLVAMTMAVEEVVKGGIGSGRKKYRYKDMAGNIKVFHADSEKDARKQAEQHFRGNKFISHEPSEEKNELEKGGEGSRGGKVIGKGNIVYDSPVQGHYANVIVRNKDGKILLLKRAANKVVAPGKYCLPGGHIDEGETIQQAAARELKEEANIDRSADQLYLIGKAKCDDGKYAFYLDCYASDGEVALLDGESDNAYWMSQDEWIECDLIFDLKDHLVAMLTKTQKINDIPDILKKGEGQEICIDYNSPDYQDELAKSMIVVNEAISEGIVGRDDIDLVKGRAAAEGEERTWGGKKYKKSGGKWLPVGSGKKDGDKEVPAIGNIVTLKTASDIPTSLSQLKGQKLKVTEHQRGTSSVPIFLTVRDESGEEHTINPNYVDVHRGKQGDQKKHSTDQLTKHAENTSSDQLKKVAGNKDHPHSDAAKRELERRAGEEGSVKDKRKALNDFKKEISSALEQADYDTDNPKVQKVLDKYMEMDTNAFDSDDLNDIVDQETEKGATKKIEYHDRMRDYHEDMMKSAKKHLNKIDGGGKEAGDIMDQMDYHSKQIEHHKSKGEQFEHIKGKK